jgi:hypothetical protein
VRTRPLPHVARTRHRPLATGAVSAREALWLFVAMMLAAFALVLLTNPLTIALSVVGVALAATYPFLKRHTYLPDDFVKFLRVYEPDIVSGEQQAQPMGSFLPLEPDELIASARHVVKAEHVGV